MTAPSSLNASITQTAFTNAYNQQWKLYATADGYQLRPRSNYSYRLSVGDGIIAGNGRNVEMRAVRTDHKDEWIFLNVDLYLGQLPYWYSDDDFNIGYWKNPPLVYREKLNSDSSFSFDQAMTNAALQWTIALNMPITFTSTAASSDIVYYGGTADEIYATGYTLYTYFDRSRQIASSTSIQRKESLTMKKIFVCFIIVAMLCLPACAKSTKNIPTQSIFEKETVFLEQRDIMYWTLEEAIAFAPHVVQAKCTSYDPKDGSYAGEVKFQIEEQYKGTIHDSSICVHLTGTDYVVSEKGYIFKDIPEYTVGESYFLILSRFIHVYLDHDQYYPISGTFIPANNPQTATMYGKEAITKHSKVKNSDLASAQTFADYLRNVSVNEPDKSIQYVPVNEHPYIESQDIDDILTQSTYVVKLIPEEELISNQSRGVAIYKCKIVRQYKGNILSSEINATFFLDSIKIDSPYIVALEAGALEGHYDLSSKSSVINAGQEQKVMEILQPTE